MNSTMNVIIGVPLGMEEGGERKLDYLLKNTFPGMVGLISFAHTVDSFVSKVNSGGFNFFICIDDLGVGNEYSRCFNRNVLAWNMKCVVVVPDRCYGTAPLKDLVDRGFTDFIFQKDLAQDILRQLASSSRDMQGALAYGGFMMTAPVPTTGVVKDEGVKPSYQIVKKYLGNGIGVTRMCAQDAKQANASGIGDADVLGELLGDADFDTELALEFMRFKEFPQDEEYIKRYKDELRKYFRNAGLMDFRAFENGDMERGRFERIVLEQLGRLKLFDDKAKTVCDSFMRDTLSYGKLDSLIRTEGVSDIRLMGKDIVNVQYHGEWYRTNVSFVTEEEYTHFINRMCVMNRAQLNMREADTIFTDIHTFPDYILRITVTHGMLSTSASFTACIRVTPRKKRTTQELMGQGFWTKEQAAMLITAMRKKKSIIICGGSGSGKTISLNTLMEYLPPGICGSCIQQSDELHSESHPNIEFLHSLEATGEGGTTYDLKRLATTALLKNVELFIIGEIKGDEASDFFTASRTASVYSTTHAEDVFGALPRIVELAKYNADYSQEDILRILAKNVDYVVYCDKYKCKQIASVVGYDMERRDVVYDLYEFNAKEADYR